VTDAESARQEERQARARGEGGMCWNGGLSGFLLIRVVQARRVVMTARMIVMTVRLTTYEQKDNCEPDGLTPQSDELTKI
jgi:hypothetical protein